MNKKILGIGNAIVDVLAKVNDEFLINNNLFGQITNQKVPTVDDQRKIQQNPTLKKSPQEIFKEPVEDDQIKKEEMYIKNFELKTALRPKRPNFKLD